MRTSVSPAVADPTQRPAPPAIAVRSVTKTFFVPRDRRTTVKERLAAGFGGSSGEELRAVDDVTFDVQRGEFFGIVGRNGSGKSTLLKCIAGIYDPSPGEVVVSGRLSPFIELGVGFKPQFTARDNVLVNAAMLGMTRRQVRERFDDIFAFAELEDFVDLKLKNYSSGMNVRLAFSLAIQADPDVLLLDEVLAVGDAAFRGKSMAQFERLKSEGRTVVLVTHSMDNVRTLCDRALLLDHGRVVACGDPDDVAAQYEETNRRIVERAPQVPGARVVGPAAPPRPAFAGAGAPARYRPSALGDDVKRFLSLTHRMAATEFRLHYEGSVLGVLWCVLRPLALFAVLWFVFTHVGRFGSGVKDYPVYLLTAVIMWTFFTEATSGSLGSLVNNQGLLRRMRFPRMAVPLSVVLKAMFNLGINGVVLLGVIVVAGIEPRLSWLELPLLVALLVGFAAGLALLLSALYVRFRDVSQLWALVTQLLFFASPIFYVVTKYPESIRQVLAASPIAAIFTEMRHALIDPSAPSAAEALGGTVWLLVPLGVIAASLVGGAWFFGRQAPHIAEGL
jgi:ABC-type polysaccharide/polyol phosphate transport system ATPase subunit/ABC-type polysaccharide/polyol phosphate export permease